MVAAGTAAQTDNAWHEGLSDWQPLNSIIGFVQATPPPAPSGKSSKMKGDSNPPQKKKGGCLSLLAKIFLLIIGLSVIINIFRPKESPPPTIDAPKPVASKPLDTASHAAPIVPVVKPSVVDATPPAQEAFPKEGSWPDKVHLLKSVTLIGTVGTGNASMTYNQGTEVFAFLSDDHKTVNVQVEQLKATVPIEDTDFLALAKVSQAKKEEAAKQEQERMKAEAASRAAAPPSPEVQAVCDDMIKSINTVADFTLTGVVPYMSKNSGVLTLMTISSKPVLSEPSKKKVWLLTVVGSAGKALADHPSAKIDAIWMSDASTTHETKQGYVIPAATAQKLQRQVFDGTITLDQMYQQLSDSLSLVKSPALE